MTRIAASTGLDFNAWAKTKQDHIEGHQAWHNDMSAEKAESCLEGKKPFTYLLRSAGENHKYFITFVNDKGNVQHQDFVLELTLQGWHYKNFMPVKPTETVDELIPVMMHCLPTECMIHLTVSES